MTQEEINETKFGSVRMDLDQRSYYHSIKKEEFKDGCCFQNRIADYFLIGICRAYFKDVLRKPLPSKSEKKPRIFNIEPTDSGKKTRTLKNKKDFWNIFRIIAYATKIKEAGNDIETKEWKSSHKILIDSAKCTEIVEELFNGGWTMPNQDSFKDLLNKQLPDDKICEELGLLEQFIYSLEEE